jgi:hypothetical protein
MRSGRRVALVLGALVVVGLSVWLLRGEGAVRQPIEFSHKKHLDLEDPKFECTTCHDRAEKGPSAGRPSTKKCLSCHSGAEAKSPEERKLQELGAKGEIPWRRVWRLPRHVFFSHRTHVAVARVTCQTCHGPMETLLRPPSGPLKTLTMDDCIGCHRSWQPPAAERAKAAASGRPALVAAGRRPSTDCNACHR